MAEFYFVPYSNYISFNFIMASEEYGQSSWECTFSDTFAFFLTNISTGETTNLAVLPGTDEPILVTNIHLDNGACDAQNEQQYFGGYIPVGEGPIEYDGYTVPMTAFSEVTPGQEYHIRMVIADANDSVMDTAVFIEGGSFYIGTEPIVPTVISDCEILQYSIELDLNGTLNNEVSITDGEDTWDVSGDT